MYIVPLIKIKDKKIIKDDVNGQMIENPLDIVKKMIKLKIKLVHVIDLDYEKTKKPINFDVLENINSIIHTQMQVFDKKTAKRILDIDSRPISNVIFKELINHENFKKNFMLFYDKNQKTEIDFNCKNILIDLDILKKIKEKELKNKKSGTIIFNRNKKQIIEKIKKCHCEKLFFCVIDYYTCFNDNEIVELIKKYG